MDYLIDISVFVMSITKLRVHIMSLCDSYTRLSVRKKKALTTVKDIALCSLYNIKVCVCVCVCVYFSKATMFHFNPRIGVSNKGYII